MKNIKLMLLFFSILTFSCSNDENISLTQIEQKYSHSVQELNLLDDINLYRVSIGLNSLEIIEHISFISSEHNDYMITNQKITHEGFEQRKNNLKQVLGAYRVGENIAYGFSTNQAAIDAWIDSESHKTNLEGDYTHFGLSIKTDNTGKKYYTNMFIKK